MKRLPLNGYVTAMLAVAAVLLILKLSQAFFVDSPPLILFLMAVTFAGWYGGFRAGFWAILLGSLASAGLLGESHASLSLTRLGEPMRLFLLFGIGGLLSLSVSLLIRMQDRALREALEREKRLRNEMVERRQAERILQRRNKRLELLSRAAAYLLETDNPDCGIREFFDEVKEHFGLSAYFSFMVNEAGNTLRLDSCAGIPSAVERSTELLEFGQAVCAIVAQERRRMIVSDVQQSDDPRMELLKKLGVRAFACHPLLMGNRLLGTLSFATRHRDQFDADEIEFFKTLCYYVAMTKERLRLITELKERAERLKESSRRKDEFLAMLSHELRNPLAPIRNAVQVVKVLSPPESQLHWANKVIERQVNHLSRLVDDLLDVSRIIQGKIKLHMAPLDLIAVIDQALETCQPLIKSRRHELKISLPDQPLWLEGDGMRLAQAISNLLNNAAKYTPDGGKIWLTATRENDAAVVCVRDTGEGISQPLLPHVFELFTQSERTIDRSQGGLGIGLTIVQKIVELHNGKVEARSAGQGMGSEFVVRLSPLKEHTLSDDGGKGCPEPAAPACAFEKSEPCSKIVAEGMMPAPKAGSFAPTGFPPPAGHVRDMGGRHSGLIAI
jgi:signal transduction histidine kinase